MLSLQRLMQWSLVAGLLFLSSPTYALDDAAVGVEAVGETDVTAPQDRRQLWDFWSLLALLHPCPPGPLGAHCHSDSESYWGDEGGGEWEGDGTEGYEPDYGGDYEQDAEAASYSYQEDAGSSGADYQEKRTAGGGGFASAGGAFRVYMVFLVGSILSATVAVHMGQRKNPMVQGNTNEIKGAVARRIGSVSAFATGAFAGSKAKKEVEMSESSQPLQMDMGPDESPELESDGSYDNVV
eukprot:CAMPEP_0117016076 /NCGR_PEP_ID=MMETSP0472-20121206/12719_1 /TAXON_ID=693140 ORGANISM="Tiarina fusus, Strain LIS" /NCGR_SAMPLE_ID=MMETSP0472 /ASSEMBLY_ACC=CAM_ASM_000603 /LENGTH=238 /DNA_ID=CAMNT_0004720009 /DNA_START=44 /DNA_END=760 /DNA_ORIENTATION=+